MVIRIIMYYKPTTLFRADVRKIVHWAYNTYYTVQVLDSVVLVRSLYFSCGLVTVIYKVCLHNSYSFV